MDQKQKRVHPLYPKCEEAIATGILDLKQSELTLIPQAVFKFMSCAEADVKECDISHNELKYLQPQLPLKFNNLTNLNLAHNMMSTLPVEIGSLRGLEVLDFSYNVFCTLPDIVFQLPHLTLLYAHGNIIREVDLTKPIETDRLDLVDLRYNPLTREFCRNLMRININFRVALYDEGHCDYGFDNETDSD
ncbi:leucine-rich repeat protein soc-2-like [Drosophila madeirensis]|uniref:Leucine-rich repeat protein soc-2-like n=1 Tax=Drosophila madeirensis TaxID=30013 RepID=A0AAU9FZ71_DROMD